MKAPVAAGDEGRKDDANKPRTDLLPPRALLEVASLLGHGAQKYAPNNWKNIVATDDGRQRYIAAALRHLLQHQAGERFDAESRRTHLVHAVASLLFVIEGEEIHGSEKEGPAD